MSSLKMWFRVPNESTLEVSVTPKPGRDSSVVTAAAVTIDDLGATQHQDWTQADLVPGPKTLTLTRPGRYTVRVWIQFKGTNTSTAEVEAKVVKNGSVHGDPYTYTVTGANNAVERSTIIALTQKN